MYQNDFFYQLALRQIQAACCNSPQTPPPTYTPPPPYNPPPPPYNPPPPPWQPPAVDCPTGWVRDPVTGKCVANVPTPQDPPTEVPVPCPPGTVRASNGKCVRRGFQPPPQVVPCPDGFTRNAAGKCVRRGFQPTFPGGRVPQIPRPTIPQQCPEGYTWQQANDGNWYCLPIIR